MILPVGDISKAIQLFGTTLLQCQKVVLKAVFCFTVALILLSETIFPQTWSISAIKNIAPVFACIYRQTHSSTIFRAPLIPGLSQM